MTLKRAYDEVLLRTIKHRNVEGLDWGTIVLFINRAWKEVLTKTLPYKDWAYVKTTQVFNGCILPNDFIKHLRLLVSSNGRPPYVEARYSDIKEYYRVTNWKNRHNWNYSTAQNPIYTLWGHLPVPPDTDTQSGVTIYISPNTDYQTGVAPAGYEYYTDNYQGVLEYYGMPADVSGISDRIPVPYEFEELVILLSVLRVLYKTDDTKAIETVQSKIQEEMQGIYTRYKEFKKEQKSRLESFVEPVPPFVSGQPEQGELPNNLIGGKK